MQIDSSIFKAYDIRGVVDKTLTEEAARAIGQALGALAKEKNVDTMCVGRDGRLSGPKLSRALMEGITDMGIHVKSIGMTPTPVLYFATVLTKTGSGVAVTGSHNPPEYNGLKMMMGKETLYGDGIQALRKKKKKGISVSETKGKIEEIDVLTPYLEKILGDVKLARPMKIAIDCGNGVTGPTALELFKRLGCEVTPLYAEIDGHFPNHHPDPSKPANLVDLIETVKFLKVHVFPYSVRPGTLAENFGGKISKSVKTKRVHEAIEKSSKTCREVLQSFLGKTCDVLYETLDREGFYEGYTREYIPVKTRSLKDLRGKIIPTEMKTIKNNYILCEYI